MIIKDQYDMQSWLFLIAMKISGFIFYYPNKSDSPAQSASAVVAPRTLPAHVCNDVKSAVGVSKPLTVVV